MPITKRTIFIIVLVACCAVVLAVLYIFYFKSQQKNLPAVQKNVLSGEPAIAPLTTQQQINTPVQPPQLTQLPTKQQTLLNATFTNPYPVQWEYQRVQFAITAVSLDQQTSKITFYFKIMNANPFYTEAACGQFPSNAMRWVPDESGDMIEPSSNKSYGCGLPANVTRNKNEEVYFDISGGSSPYTFTTGGASNIFFFVKVSPDGTINIENLSNEKSG